MDYIVLLTAYHLCMAHGGIAGPSNSVEAYEVGFEQCAVIVPKVDTDRDKVRAEMEAVQKAKDQRILDQATAYLKQAS